MQPDRGPNALASFFHSCLHAVIEDKISKGHKSAGMEMNLGKVLHLVIQPCLVAQEAAANNQAVLWTLTRLHWPLLVRRRAQNWAEFYLSGWKMLRLILYSLKRNQSVGYAAINLELGIQWVECKAWTEAFKWSLHLYFLTEHGSYLSLLLTFILPDGWESQNTEGGGFCSGFCHYSSCEGASAKIWRWASFPFSKEAELYTQISYKTYLVLGVKGKGQENSSRQREVGGRVLYTYWK